MDFAVDKKADVKQYTLKGSKIPSLPKKGEIMICQICKKPIMPNQFSSDKYKRNQEFKWHIHPKCFEYINQLADKSVLGLISERKALKK